VAAAVSLVQVLLSAALVLAFSRLVRGPSLADRVVALDLTALVVVGLIAVYEIQTGEPVLLDAAIVLALIGFVSTVAFARYLERRIRR
jgi:multicomponent Na+:H+ antiporter subunit F